MTNSTESSDEVPVESAGYLQIRYETIGLVARITLARPRYRNAQSRIMRDELDAAFAVAVDDPDVRAIIVRGEGDSFCAGHDIGTAEEREDRRRRPISGSRAKHSWEMHSATHLRWRALPKPTIAQVHGYCLLGGWSFAAAMDIVTAAEDATFLPGIAQYFSIPYDIGLRRAKEILFESRFVSGREAYELGFVNHVAPADELDELTLALAGRIAENNPLYVRLVKQALNEAQDTARFTDSIETTHKTFMKAELTGSISPGEGSNRLPMVDLALRRRERT